MMEPKEVPYIVYESEAARHERTVRRLLTALLISILLMVATNLCGGFAGVNAAISNGFAQAEIAANARAMNDMQSMFGIQSSLQNCCCENRAAIADLKSTIAAEACADRAAVTDGVRSILDVICQDKIDSKNEKILELQNSLNMANLAASQVAQTAEIISKLPAATTTA